MESLRLNKVLATVLGIGRRQADLYITEGRVTVNGQVARLGQRCVPKDLLTLDGRPITTTVKGFTYLALHKPTGYVCSRRQQGEAPTIYSLLPAKYQHLKPVGRLDKDSSGLLLLTDDGDFALRMTHPRYKKIKRYEVTIHRPLAPLHRQMISDIGLDLPDGNSKLILERLKEENDTWWQVTMHEGRNRQIRRTFAALGYTVTKLHRIELGDYALGALKPGGYELVASGSEKAGPAGQARTRTSN